MNPIPPQLSEKDFIHEPSSKDKFPFWLWGILFTMVVSLLWGSYSWYTQKITNEIESNPFLQVTNRQMSLFLWQFPEFMRINVKSGKSGYLPGFQYVQKISLEPEMADQYVSAPPELLFLYHTWDRLLNPEFVPRPIQLSEFKEFLLYAVEWQPQYWLKAPPDYVKFANSLLENKNDLPKNLTHAAPKEVIQAFQGWKNFFKEGEAINHVKATYAKMSDFLKVAPHYARPFWRNIMLEQYPHYLKSITTENGSSKEEIPSNELAPFLRVAFFNYTKSL